MGSPFEDEVQVNEHLEHFNFLGDPLNFFHPEKNLCCKMDIE